jgi:metal-responsive CopG/Arc/MetJ family transcriptional regulator
MASKDEVDRIWKLSEKTRMNISLPDDLAKWLDKNASTNWQLDRGARSKEMTKILLDAKRESEEKV